MNNASSLIAYGSYVSDGNARTIEIQPGVDYFILKNRTDWGDTTAVTNVMSEYQRGMNPGTGYGWTQTVTTNALASNAITSGGFTFLDSTDDSPDAALTASGITNAAPPVVTVASTATLTDNDIVRVYASTGALQISTYDFTINVLNGTTFSLLYMPAPGSAASAAQIRRIPFDVASYPRNRLITAVTAGVTTEVQMSVTHGFVVGQIVSFVVPSVFGMTQLDGLQGQITAINTTTNTITVDIDSSGFTAFAFPTSAVAALGFTPAQVIPLGEVATILTGASRSTGFRGINLGANVVGPNAATMDWWAFKADVNV